MSLDQWSSASEEDWDQMPVCSAGLLSFGGQRGYYHDPETELYLLGCGTGSAPGNGETSKGAGRFYDPDLGRFLTQDPLGLASGSINLYRYVNNNPVDSVDPSGNWTVNRDTNELIIDTQSDRLWNIARDLTGSGAGDIKVSDTTITTSTRPPASATHRRPFLETYRPLF